MGRETWAEFLGCRKVLPAVPVVVVTGRSNSSRLLIVEFVEADSGCFPFDFDEIKVKCGDVGPFGYKVNYISNHSEGRKR